MDNEFESVTILSTKLAGYEVSKRSTLGVTGFYGINADDRHQMVAGLFTNGDQNHNFTIGLGAYFTNWDDYIYDPSTFSGHVAPANQASALLTFSGMWRVSKSTFLITENWITSYDEHENIFSFGVRFTGSKLAFDAGLKYLSYNENYSLYLGLSYKF